MLAKQRPFVRTSFYGGNIFRKQMMENDKLYSKILTADETMEYVD